MKPKSCQCKFLKIISAVLFLLLLLSLSLQGLLSQFDLSFQKTLIKPSSFLHPQVRLSPGKIQPLPLTLSFFVQIQNIYSFPQTIYLPFLFWFLVLLLIILIISHYIFHFVTFFGVINVRCHIVWLFGEIFILVEYF